MPKTLSRGRISAKSSDNEKLLAINELQDVASSVCRGGPFKATTAGAGPAVIWTSDTIPEGQLWSIVATVQGQASNDQAFFVRAGLFYRHTGGVVIETDAVSIATIRSDSQVATYDIAGNTVTMSVSGLVGSYNWATWIEIRVST